MKLLVVDDNKYVVESLRKMIRKEEFGISEVLGAYSVPQAERILETEEVDLLICDIEMPGEKGFQLLEYIERNGLDIETIMLTSYSNFDYAKQALSYHVDDYLLKPAAPEELNEAVGRMAEKKRKRMKEEKLMEYGSHWLSSVNLPDEGNDEVSGREINEIREYILNNLASVNRTSIAEHFFITPNYLSRLFKKETGMLLTEYIQQERMTKAQELLKKTELSVSEIALQTGYPSFAHFSKQFRRFTGDSPNEYRKRFRR